MYKVTIEAAEPQLTKETLLGIENTGTDPNFPEYDVLPDLALYLASNLQKCGEIINQNVIRIMCEFTVIGEDDFVFNNIDIQLGPQGTGALLNPYRVLARAILNNEALRAQILDPSFRALQIYIDEVGNPGIRVGNEPPSPTAPVPNSSTN